MIKKLGNYKRLGNHNPNELKTIHIFLFTTVEQTLSPIDPDNPEAKWVSVDEVIHVLTSEIDKEFFQNQLQEIKSVFTP